jgi:hypothetical protein
MTAASRAIAFPAGLCVFLTALLCALAAPRLDAGQSGGEKVAYELREGATVTDECVTCDRAPIIWPLIGTFTVTRVEDTPLDFEVYELTDIVWRDPFRVPGQEYVFTGSGTYRKNTRDGTATLKVDLDWLGTKVVLESTPAPETTPWPAMDVTVTEDGTRDEFHKLTIRVLAAPEAKPVVAYELLEDSALINECVPCGRQPIITPLAGEFTLGRIAADPFSRSVHRIDGIFFQDTVEGINLQVTGNGTLVIEGEIAVFETMDLELTLNAGETVETLRFVAGPETPRVGFPALDMTLKDTVASRTRVLSLRLVARPKDGQPPVQYRRGDANADGRADISDGIFILTWRFLGGRPPSCLDAADANDDDQHDLTDAVFVLNHLFQGGTAPPAPGLDACGPSPNVSLGCESFAPCEA